MVTSVKIGYDCDDFELCQNINCYKGMVLTDKVADDGKFIPENCPECCGRGFKLKKGKIHV